MSTLKRTIALLATGNELTQGDILNTNSRDIAALLSNAKMCVGLHATAPDTVAEMEKAIAFLLDSNEALIITGGLGPTSDDLTRVALSNVIHTKLVFHEEIWQNICERLKRFGYPTPPESNRQQAFFPDGSTVIPNQNGTAAGCMLEYKNKFIFMLPGPPMECLPMVSDVVIPTLTKAEFPAHCFNDKWFLFGVSEGKIAEALDEIAHLQHVDTGYRLDYPYIEFKLYSDNEANFTNVKTEILNVISPFLIGDGQTKASDALKEKLAKGTKQFTISDHATGGALECALLTPETFPYLQFTHQQKSFPFIEIFGLEEYWLKQKDKTKAKLTMMVSELASTNSTNIEIPFRNHKVNQYAVEYLASEMLKLFN